MSAAAGADVPPSGARRAWWRRPPIVVGVAAVVVLLAGLVWIVVTGLMARSELQAARGQLQSVRRDLSSGDPAAGDATLASFARHAHRAHLLTTGPAWATAAVIPWIGDPAQTLRGLTREGDVLATDALPGVRDIAAQVADGQLRNGDRIDVGRLVAIAPDVASVSDVMNAADRRIESLPRHTWLPPLNSAAADVNTQIGTLAAGLRSANTAVQVLPDLLGATTPQRFFVAFQNNAEARGTGGLPGAFAIVTAVNGQVTFERFEPDGTLVDPTPVSVDGEVDFGAAQQDYVKQYGADLPFGDYRDSNESPHFAYAAQIWAAMWQKYSGETVTGAVAVDPVALSYLLGATGPVQLSDGTELTAGNIVAKTLKDVYAQFPGLAPADIERRKDYLLDVASRTEKALLAGRTDTTKLVAGASRGASERRLLVWSADPAVEAVLAGTSAGGAVQETKDPYSYLVVNNVAGTKLDYYLKRSLSYQASGCGDSRDVTVTVTLLNAAPATGLPGYVTYRADRPAADTPVGSNRTMVDYFATDGALLQSATIDGQPSSMLVYDQRGHPVFRTILETPPGGSHTVILHLREPRGSGNVTDVQQPLVQPLTFDSSQSTC